MLPRPNVDLLAGVPPTVAIEQRLSRGGRKSTVATVTEIYHYLRLLYAKIGVQHCATLRRGAEPAQPRADRRAASSASSAARRSTLLAPAVRGRKGIYNELFQAARKLGFKQARIDGKHRAARSRSRRWRATGARHRHRRRQRSSSARAARRRCAELVASALRLGSGAVDRRAPASEERLFSERLYCGRLRRRLRSARSAPVLVQQPPGRVPSCDGHRQRGDVRARAAGRRRRPPARRGAARSAGARCGARRRRAVKRGRQAASHFR